MFLATTETINTPTTETINKCFPATTETFKQPASETSPKNTNKNEESLDTSENVESSCGGRIHQISSDGIHKTCFPATTEAINNQRRKPYKNVSCDDGNLKQTNDGNRKQTLDDFDDGNHKKDVLTVSVTN